MIEETDPVLLYIAHRHFEDDAFVSDKLRDNVPLRIHAAKLLTAFGALLREHAEQYVFDLGKSSDAFGVDYAAELLLWRVHEYISWSHINLNDYDWQDMPKPHQFTEEHMKTFYDLTLALKPGTLEWELVPTED